MNNKNIFIGLLLITATFLAFNFAETSFTEKIIKRFNAYQSSRAQEKTHVHFDKPYYAAGENIWFRTYLVNGQTHLPDAISSIAYMELINPNGDILITHTIKADKDGGAGDFYLADTLRPGVYMVRGYTNNMRNFDESYFFHKNLKIIGAIKINLPKKTDIKYNNAITDENFNHEPNTQIKLKFYPEGGYLVNELPNLVGVKVTDEKGGSIDVNGFIEDENENKVSLLHKTKFGIGSFKISPISDKK